MTTSKFDGMPDNSFRTSSVVTGSNEDSSGPPVYGNGIEQWLDINILQPTRRHILEQAA